MTNYSIYVYILFVIMFFLISLIAATANTAWKYVIIPISIVFVLTFYSVLSNTYGVAKPELNTPYWSDFTDQHAKYEIKYYQYDNKWIYLVIEYNKIPKFYVIANTPDSLALLKSIEGSTENKVYMKNDEGSLENRSFLYIGPTPNRNREFGNKPEPLGSYGNDVRDYDIQPK